MTTEPAFRLGSVALPVYLPSLLFAIGEGAIIPVIPVDAARLGGSLALAGFISALIMVGTLIGDIPSGWIVAKVGERNAMLGSAVAALAGLVLCLIATAPAVLGAGVLVIGIATASFALARQAFMTTFVPRSHRARALSLLGGMFRAGYFVGPFLAAAVITLTGSTRSVFAIHAVACVVVAIVLLVLPDPSAVLAERRTALAAPTASVPVVPGPIVPGQPPAEREGLFRTLVRHRQVLARMGLAAALIGGLRSSRMVILPLAGVGLGMQEGSIALVVGVAGAVDLALFFTSGQIMDRFGRLWSALPSMIGLGLGHLALALVVWNAVRGGSSDRVVWFVVVALGMSLANGVGSGILMTFGADLAPRHDPAPFLGAYRFTGDAGNAAAPLTLSALTAAVSLSFAAAVIGVAGLVGAALIARWVPRFIPRTPRVRPA